MGALEKWAPGQIEQKKVEANSELGHAINSMLKRWDKLTLFLRKPGAPLDNRACEQILRRAVRHRRNGLPPFGRSLHSLTEGPQCSSTNQEILL